MPARAVVYAFLLNFSVFALFLGKFGAEFGEILENRRSCSSPFLRRPSKYFIELEGENMKKRIFAILMAAVMVMTLVIGAIPAMAAEDGVVTIRIHYHRPDGDYEGWELWSWDLDGNYEVSGSLASDGTPTNAPPYKLEPSGDEVVATITVPTGTMRVGYIIRYGEWKGKDNDSSPGANDGYDQFINITGILSGTVDFYIESGVTTQPNKDAIPSMEELRDMVVEYNGKEQNVLVPSDDCKYGVVVTAADYDTDSKGDPLVKVQLSSEPKDEITASTFTITGQDNNVVGVSKVVKMQATYYLYLESELALDKSYKITFEENDYAVTLPDYYSTKEFEDKYTYTGNDLGATYTKEKTTLKVWAPLAVGVQVWLYKNGDPAQQAEPDEKLDMTAGEKGTWSITLDGDKNGTYYTYYVDNYTEQKECVDPYARTTGVNGRRGMIIDLDATDPEGWANDKDPHYDNNITDAIIWELHVRDLSIDPSSGIKAAWRGKYLGLTETGTVNSFGQSTGLDYIKNLGITHIHLLPVYDFGSVDETKSDGFNWGYDPMNYNVPEGSYSTDPYNGEVRVKEFKQMVKTLHDNGISVIMDVVYNHVYDSAKFCMNNIVPDYFSRPNSNGSGCGNDTASERSMVSKYIVDSVNYWADEYHIDGFRFDLVGLIDTNTINEIVSTVHETHPNVIFYGEGWTMGTATTKPVSLATQTNSAKTPGFAYFSDTIRNTLKGGTYGGVSAGYISGGGTGELNNCFKGMPSWCTTPSQSVNYISCHDNNTLFDHISIVKPDASYEEKCDMTKLGVAFYMVAQGIPFFQAGEEMNRSKPDSTKADGFNENSYNASDSVNSIKWDNLYDQPTLDVVEYYKGLIAFRKAHPSLRLTDNASVNKNVFTLPNLESNVLGYRINGGSEVNGETAEAIVAIYNANSAKTTVELPEGEWHICVNKDEAGVYSLGTVSGSVEVEGVSAMILVKGNVEAKPGAEAQPNWIIVIAVIGVVTVLCTGAILVVAGGVALLSKKKK